MRISVVAFSECGAALARRLALLSEEGHEVGFYIAERHSAAVERAEQNLARQVCFEPFTSVFALTERIFASGNALVFVGACGIAVRAIAPLIKTKLSDPAVVVIDETGRFVISLLCGHVGGANKLTRRLADIISATPVITTASDAHGQSDKYTRGNLILGIGCRKGLSAEELERTVTIVLWDRKIPLRQVAEIATIDVKRNDEGLQKFAKTHKLPVTYYSAAELAAVPGDYAHSDRVKRAVGVGNVCERACVLRGGNGRIIMQKTVKDGIAVAVFEQFLGRV